MIEFNVPCRADADLVVAALQVAAGQRARRELSAGERNRCALLAEEIRDGLAEVPR